MVFGGLRPIASRAVLDVVAVASLAYCTFTPVESSVNTVLLFSAALLTVATADFTNRWTLTFPMVPVLVLQSLRRFSFVSEVKWVSVLVTILTAVFLAFMVALSLLFPAVELPPIKGKYNIGMVSLHLPVDYSKVDDSKSFSKEDDSFVNVRVLYPTNEKPDRLPYLDPSTAADYLAQCISFGAPPALKKFGWLLHNWRLIQLDVKHNAKPINQPSSLPCVIYSHGLGGSPSIYSYQTHSLAANGYLVLAIEHSDGSAPLTKKRDGSVVTYDYDIGKLWSEGKEVEYVRERRARTNHRVREYLAATLSLLDLNDKNIPELDSVGVSFVNTIDPNDVHFMGHSFGGATCLTAAVRRPDLVVSIVAHEPVLDWMPDDARRALFEPERVKGAPREYEGGTGGFESGATKNSLLSILNGKKTIHDIPMLFLYSEEWKSKGWGSSDILEYMHQQGKLGRRGSDFGVIPESHHNEFSDTSKLTPVWLGRMVGVTGKRSPLDTGEEIKERTLAFLDTVRQQQ